MFSDRRLKFRLWDYWRGFNEWALLWLALQASFPDVFVFGPNQIRWSSKWLQRVAGSSEGKQDVMQIRWEGVRDQEFRDFILFLLQQTTNERRRTRRLVVVPAFQRFHSNTAGVLRLRRRLECQTGGKHREFLGLTSALTWWLVVWWPHVASCAAGGAAESCQIKKTKQNTGLFPFSLSADSHTAVYQENSSQSIKFSVLERLNLLFLD